MSTNRLKRRILRSAGLGAAAALALSGLASPAHSSPDDGLIPPLKDVYSDYFKVGKEAWNAEPQGERGTYYDLDDPAAADLFHKEGFTYWVGKIDNRMELEAIQAQRFAEYFAVYKKYSQDLDRVTFWGLTDALNWRRNHNPQLFNADFSQKLA